MHLGATALVLLPFWWAGSTGLGAPFLPWQVSGVWEFAQLFTHSTPTWSSQHVQLLGQDGRWHEVPHDPPFRHALFGGQTRLDWLLLYFDAEPASPEDAERLAAVRDHLCHTYAELYAEGELAEARLPAAALPIQRARLLTFERHSSIDAPPPKRYSRSLPGRLRLGNHVILVECAAPRVATGT